jgi:hypothetical protein
MAVPSALYSFLMFVTAGLFGWRASQSQRAEAPAPSGAVRG